MTRQQEWVARMIAKGFSYRESAAAVGIGTRQVERWMSPSKGLPGFRARVEQLREENPEPGADEMLRAALGATKRDGSPDWMVIIAAAKALKMTPPDPAAATDWNGGNPGGAHITMYFLRDPETGEPIFGDGEVIDAEATEIPPPSGHGILPPGPAA